MSQEKWAKVDSYLVSSLLESDPTLEAALRGNLESGLPQIDVSPTQGKLLHLLARLHRAKSILEIGTLGGYSTIWLARALPADGLLVTLELEPRHAEVARANVDRAGVGEKVEIKIGPAADTLKTLDRSFDFIFIDADKPNIPVYWQEALRLSHPGSVIIVDNVIRDGEVSNSNSDDPSILGVRALMNEIAATSNVEATAIQTVGAKGYDGFLIAIVKG